MSSLRTRFTSESIEPFYVGGASASLSAGGDILVTAVNEDVVMTNLENQSIVQKIEGDGELVTCLTITPDGKYIAILSQSQQLRIFDVENERVVKSFKMSSPVYVSCADETSSLFAFGGTDGVITVWDVESNYVTHSLKGHGSTISSLCFFGKLNTSSWRLASGDTMGHVKVWDLVKRKCITTVSEHTSAVRGVSFNELGTYFLSAGRDQTVVVYSTKNFKPIKTLLVKEQVENAGFIDLPWDNENSSDFIYTAGSNNVLRIWDMQREKVIAETATPIKTTEELMIVDVLRVRDEALVLVLSDQTLVFVDIEEPDTESSSVLLRIMKRIAGNHGIIADIKYAGPDLELIALATNSPSLRIVDPNHPLEVVLCEGHTDILNAVDVSSDGLWIATASKDNTARIWRWQDSGFKPYAVFQGHAGAVTAVSLPKVIDARAPQFLLTASSDLTVKKWTVPINVNDVQTVKSAAYTRRAHDKDINALDVSPNDQYFATASYDKLGKVWDVESGETIGVLKGHRRGLWDVSFCKYDKLIVTSSGDKTVKLWKLDDYTCSKTFEGHTNAVQRAKFINRNQQVVSSGADGLIKVWDVKDVTGDCLVTLDNHENRIWALDQKDDGLQMVSADADGYISVWTDNTEEYLLEQAEKEKLKVEQDQELSNFISNGKWSEAFLLALTLEHPMRLYNILKGTIAQNANPESDIGSFELENTIGKLNNDQILSLFTKLRDWNVNNKLFEVSQRLLAVIFKKHSPEDLVEIPGIIKIIDSILPYSERHYSRIDDLIEQSYILDYALEQMNRLS